MATAPGTRGRTIRAAVAAAIEEAREAGRIEPHHEPDAAVALRVAGALGRPKVSTTDLVRLSGELRKLLDRLPLTDKAAPGGAGADDGDAAAGGAGRDDARAAGLALVVGAGPEVGDTALPR
jgi:hypothetical protein